MIQITTTYCRRQCGSTDIVRNGRNKCGSAQYHCKACGGYRVLRPKPAIDQQRREQVLQTYRERTSLRGLERIFGVDRHRVLKWVAERVKQLPTLAESLLPKVRGDVLEFDELWSFVCRRCNKRWLWSALCRRTRQIVGFDSGDRDEATCQRLWESIPAAYRRCRSYSDFLKAYQAVLPKRTHHAVGKDSGQTAYQERWYNTLRQRLGRFTRETLAFSKTDRYHELVTRWYSFEYNLSRKALLTKAVPQAT